MSTFPTTEIKGCSPRGYQEWARTSPVSTVRKPRLSVQKPRQLFYFLFFAQGTLPELYKSDEVRWSRAEYITSCPQTQYVVLLHQSGKPESRERLEWRVLYLSWH